MKEAEIHARRALELKGDFREARNTLAVVLINGKRPTEAVTVLKPLTEDILYQTPENALGQPRLGLSRAPDNSTSLSTPSDEASRLNRSSAWASSDSG